MWPFQVLLCSSWLTFSCCGLLLSQLATKTTLHLYSVGCVARAVDHKLTAASATHCTSPRSGLRDVLLHVECCGPAGVHLHGQGQVRAFPKPHHHPHTSHAHTHTPRDRENRLSSPLTNVPRSALACALRSSGADERFGHGVRYPCDGLRVLAHERTRLTSVLLSLRVAGRHTHTHTHSHTLLSHAQHRDSNCTVVVGRL
jgi:hypothetical protein